MRIHFTLLLFILYKLLYRILIRLFNLFYLKLAFFNFLILIIIILCICEILNVKFRNHIYTLARATLTFTGFSIHSKRSVHALSSKMLSSYFILLTFLSVYKHLSRRILCAVCGVYLIYNTYSFFLNVRNVLHQIIVPLSKLRIRFFFNLTWSSGYFS
jgi:hypothetical protein